MFSPEYVEITQLFFYLFISEATCTTLDGLTRVKITKIRETFLLEQVKTKETITKETIFN